MTQPEWNFWFRFFNPPKSFSSSIFLDSLNSTAIHKLTLVKKPEIILRSRHLPKTRELVHSKQPDSSWSASKNSFNKASIFQVFSYPDPQSEWYFAFQPSTSTHACVTHVLWSNTFHYYQWQSKSSREKEGWIDGV